MASTAPCPRLPAAAHLSWPRWLLRECVRANPLYVISAASLGYGAVLISSELDPNPAASRSALLAAGIVHLYEFALLGVAALVLKKRREGGRDLHGLLIVAVLFLTGGLMMLDQLVEADGVWGPLWMLGALALAALKLLLYAALPGLRLPRRYLGLALVILAAHGLSVLLGHPARQGYLRPEAAQGLGWCAGWLTFIPCFLMLAHELKRQTPTPLSRITEAQVVNSRIPGGCLLGLSALSGQVHCWGGDYVFDRPVSVLRFGPALLLVLSMLVFLAWYRHGRVNRWRLLAALLPCGAALWAGWAEGSAGAAHSGTADLQAWAVAWHGVAFQSLLAGALGYVLLGFTLKQPIFLAGIVPLLLGPPCYYLYLIRATVPHLRGLLAVSIGFTSLLGGLLMSLKRQRLLGWLEDGEPEVEPRPRHARSGNGEGPDAEKTVHEVLRNASLEAGEKLAALEKGPADAREAGEAGGAIPPADKA